MKKGKKMQTTYKIGQKVRLTSNSEILGSSDALKPYLGSVVTIASVDEDGVYTVEEIDGFEISEIDIEEAININFTKWVEECVCPFCGSGNYSDEPYYETTEVFRDFTCNDCGSEWSERYNLTVVTAHSIDHVITSELEDRLQTQNNQLKAFIKNLGYDEHQIDIICNCNVSEKSETIETNKYSYYWLDPEFELPNTNIFASSLCEIVDYPLLAMTFKCYSKIDYNDYDHCDEEDGEFGLEIGEFDINGNCLDSLENTFFITNEQREDYIRTLELFNRDDVAKEEFYNNPKIYKDLRNYCDDAIFYIKTIQGSEAEVYKSELWQLVEVEAAGKYGLFVNIEKDENNRLKVNYSPALVDGSMSPHLQDYTLIDEEYENLPIEQLATFAFLQTTYTEDRISFDFDGNDYIEAFHAHIVSFKFDTDNSIIATIVDMEDNHFDVSWEEIKNSEFEGF